SKRTFEFSGAFRFRSRPSFARADALIALPLGRQQNGTRLLDLIGRKDVAVMDEPEPAYEALFARSETFLMTYGMSSARFYRLDSTPESLRLPGHAGLTS